MKISGLLHSRLGQATVWNLAGAALPLLLGLLSIPILVRGMGQEAFGLLTLLWTAIGYVSLFDFGLGRALTHSIAAARAAHAPVPRALLVTGALSTLLPGTVGAAVVLCLAEPLVLRWLNIGPDLQEDALRAFYWVAVGIPLVSLSSGLRGMLEGYEDFKAAAILRMGLGALNFLLPMGLVLAGYPGLEVMVMVLLGSRLLSLLHNLYLLRVAYGQSVGRAWEWHRLPELLGIGGWMGLSNLLGPIMVNFDRYLIAGLLSAELVAYYTVPQDLVIRLLFVPVALSTALFPRMTWLFASGSRLEAKALYRKALWWIGLGTGLPLLLLAVLAQPALLLWLGPAYAATSAPLGQILLLGILFNGLAMIPFAAIQARGGAKITSAFHLLELLLYWPLLYWAVKEHALMGAAWVWTGRTAFDFVLLHFYHQSYSPGMGQKASLLETKA